MSPSPKIPRRPISLLPNALTLANAGLGLLAISKAIDALARGADPGAPSADDVGMQPLHWACTEGRLACARLLVDRGADRGRKRVRNSQLQRLISRPFSTRFG